MLPVCETSFREPRDLLILLAHLNRGLMLAADFQQVFIRALPLQCNFIVLAFRLLFFILLNVILLSSNLIYSGASVKHYELPCI